ncbi:hypothetical protein A3A76_04100 [Candidatus Woesebacteria bacterium RIFCSPLOWO2_01_FULL_39_23]|uniref:Uncharacterized protein n=1 Tax=Candidatus Woesebacteria bacterium RIFCSPHIGHO2_01_FULL_40_22 TaxID=1802499 RepID=A0A1F7YIP5_9BACT|nr:MAG: hypothetical protein A2141_03515 [Candidatus Woesebacteria bacterium RBG_16_40_11]OGM26415.1 MAG: hypothetical protein A2628_00100 [Candidatus Woesebacteria bacterium RIFCSPHIGHO2_01_FULL_40_22]OGM36047.1 MAG: hypothetical protein A3E41_00435 [Candidatus Woesebacteria bacterium RIFCSPHIGHO2_12_FULL_38_9]OGM61998.1 MAG: hypothetical protein A3A76_04100 [Candidatus Woesebacteria bacterium RIFCSPLOWO2_01_FULL_39_23]
MEISDGNVKIRIFIKNKNNLLANAIVSLETVYFGWITLKDFQIWRSQNLNNRLMEYINIKPLSRNIYGKWLERVYFEKPESWYELESKIYDAYFKAINEQGTEGT